MPGCIVSAMTASFRSVEKRRRRATPVITSTFENVSDIGVCLGLYLGPPAKAGVRSKRGAVHGGSIHLPSDLLGITPGDYDPKRSDKNLQSAVAPFCDKVRTKIAEIGSLPRTVPGELLDLVARFECCDWITNMDERVKTKQGIFKQMISLCSGRAINKNTLSQRPGVGMAIILAAAITANAENEDYQRLLNLRPATITRGVAQHVMVDTIIELDRQHKITSAERSALVSWAETFPDQDPSLPPKI